NPNICDQEAVRYASNEFIHSWLVVHIRREPWKISSSHNSAIEQADKLLCFFAQGNTGLHQQTAVSRHAGRKFAIPHKWRRGYASSGESTGLVYGTELSRIALNPAPHQRSVVVDITIWTPCYSRPLPYRVEEDTESATLISGR